jgi:hypothetical protein
MPGLPAGTYQPISISEVDAGREKASFHAWGKVLTAANHDAQIALFVTLLAKVQALVLGNRTRAEYGEERLYAWSVPTNGAAREIELQVIYQDDTTGQTFLSRVPTIDPALAHYIDNVGAKDAVLLTEPTQIVDFIAAFEAIAINPEQPSHTIHVTGLKVVRGQK